MLAQAGVRNAGCRAAAFRLHRCQRAGSVRPVHTNVLKDRPPADRVVNRDLANQHMSRKQTAPGLGTLDSFDDVYIPDVLRSTDFPALDTTWSLDSLEEAETSTSSQSDVALGAQSGEQFSGSLKGMLLLNLGALLFGSNQVVIKVAEEGLSANALSAIRFAIAAACFAPAAYKGLKNKELRNAALELGLWLFGGYTAQALGLEYTTAARGAFTGTFTVVAVPILVGLSGRKVSWTTWLAAVVALTGVGLLTTSGADPNIGDALCIASAVLFGVHKWRTETITAAFEDTQQLIAVQLAALAGAAAVMTIPELTDVCQHNTLAQLWDTAVGLPWLSLGYMGLATTALTLWIEMNALKEVSAPLAALIYTAEPLWGALFAWLVLHERWGATGWAGAALIIAASLGSQLSGDGAEKVKHKQQAAATKAD